MIIIETFPLYCFIDNIYDINPVKKIFTEKFNIKAFNISLLYNFCIFFCYYK